MRQLKVKNWSNFQHYKKRSPPWIKLHRELINDYAFMALSDAGRGHLLLIWILAAGTDGSVPHDEDFIAARIGVKGKLDLNALIEAGFLVPEEITTDGEIIIQEKPKKTNGTQDQTPVIENIPCIGGLDFAVHQSFVLELERAYPAVDVPATLKEMRAWAISNPTKQKTLSGCRRFINTWLSKEQNGGAR